MATHFSVFAWRIPRTEEPGSLQFMRSQRVGLLFVFSLPQVETSMHDALQAYAFIYLFNYFKFYFIYFLNSLFYIGG